MEQAAGSISPSPILGVFLRIGPSSLPRAIVFRGGNSSLPMTQCDCHMRCDAMRCAAARFPFGSRDGTFVCVCVICSSCLLDTRDLRNCMISKWQCSTANPLTAPTTACASIPPVRPSHLADCKQVCSLPPDTSQIKAPVCVSPGIPSMDLESITDWRGYHRGGGCCIHFTASSTAAN